jgi:cell wall-associated NlpC family hydrolase
MPPPGKMPGSRKLKYRAGVVTAGLAALGLLAATGGVALAAPAAPKPTVAQVQHKLSELNARADTLDQKLDQAKQNLQAANQRLKVLNGQAARYAKQFGSMRKQVSQIATQAYEQGSVNSSVSLLTTGNPQQILNQSSILLELSSANSDEMKQFLAAASALTNSEQAARRTKAGIVQLNNSLTKQRENLQKQQNQEKALLAQLTPAQQTGLGPGGPSTGTSTGTSTGIGGNDPLPTSTQAEKAVAFAYAQLGCPYVYGGTGPCQDGFDCSGLTMQAWAAAGIAIPRTSEEQWDLPHVSTSDLQPGDILEFAGESHVGIYVGGGELIDAPHTGANVEKVALSGWYEQELDGAVQP